MSIFNFPRSLFWGIVLGIVLFFPARLVLSTDYSSTNFKVKDPVIEGLSSYSTSTSFKVWATIPFISSQRSTSTSYISLPGFEAFASPSTATTTTPTSTAVGTVGGGGTWFLEPKPVGKDQKLKRLDFNNDGWINFIDFSILLYYFDKTGAIIEPFDLNGDGRVNIIDVSIFMYYWTGDYREGINVGA